MSLCGSHELQATECCDSLFVVWTVIGLTGKCLLALIFLLVNRVIPSYVRWNDHPLHPICFLSHVLMFEVFNI